MNQGTATSRVASFAWKCCVAATRRHDVSPARIAGSHPDSFLIQRNMIRKLPSGQYRLYSRKKDPKTGKRRNLGTFATRDKAEAHERAVQYFKRH